MGDFLMDIYHAAVELYCHRKMGREDAVRLAFSIHKETHKQFDEQQLAEREWENQMRKHLGQFSLNEDIKRR